MSKPDTYPHRSRWTIRNGHGPSRAARYALPGVLALLAGGLTSCDRKSAASASTPTSPAAEAAAAPAKEVLPAEVTFNEHIQPILSEYCYHCHGPDSGTRKPKDSPLRLDRPEEAFAARENGKPVIVKGDPAASLIMKLMTSHDPEAIMPPPDSHKTMKPHEIALLEKWISQGAEYQPHWAFAPLQRPEPPAAGEDWAANPIDRFVAKKLDEAGMKPNPPEDPRRFHRRLTLDLTGLPPSPAATDAFTKAYAANPQAAVEAEADRLLATTASAEQLTRHWLDAARYADTHGIHIDNYRNIWPYRDWVIDAFRQNMPWDRFTVEQIAGDLMPNATLEQKIATGFNRCLATTGEGGAISEEYDAIYAKDRVETTGAVWLGLTAGCAACHDHKFDPISTKEFYELTAFFRNTTMKALDGNNASHPPVVFAPLAEDRPRLAALAGEIDGARKQLTDRTKSAKGDFETWLASNPSASSPVDADLAFHLPMTEAEGPLKGTAAGQAREWAVPAERKPGQVGSAVAASSAPIDLGDLYGDLDRAKPFTFSTYIRTEGSPHGAVIARMDPGQAFRGWDLWLENGSIGSHLIDRWPDLATKFTSEKPLSPGQWHHVAVTNDPSKAKDPIQLWIDGEPAKVSYFANKPGTTIHANVPLRIGSRNNDDSRLAGGSVLIQDFRIYGRQLVAGEIRTLAKEAIVQPILALPPAERSTAQTEALYQHFLAMHDGESKRLRASITGFEKEQAELRARGSDTLVMEEKKSEPFAHVLTRGVYSDKGERVVPNTPAALPPMPADAPKNRLGFAKWLVDPANPLPARVTMNRAWYYFFGTGIVETTEDFGIMGARPSDPHLLEWMATEFIASKWNYRHMLKLIATSATYRQSGNITPEKLEKDPANRLLSRGPRVRLDAEQLRDLALSASDLLIDKAGGPSVRPYQPEGIWEAVAMKESNTRFYKQDKGEGLYRRSMYTLWKRSAAPPSMEILNAPTREVFCVRRERTNTPLQALVLLNDPQFVEASRNLAGHAMSASPDFDKRLDFIAGRLLDRPMTAEERAVVKSTLEKALATYRKQPEEAKKLIATGESPQAAGLDAPELAAWTLVSSQLLNLDEAVTR